MHAGLDDQFFGLLTLAGPSFADPLATMMQVSPLNALDVIDLDNP